MRILIRGTIILLVMDAVLLVTAGILGRSPWLLAGAAVAAALTVVVVRLGKAYDRQRARMAESRAELKEEVQILAESVRPSPDS